MPICGSYPTAVSQKEPRPSDTEYNPQRRQRLQANAIESTAREGDMALDRADET
jgi:hypothetical protein